MTDHEYHMTTFDHCVYVKKFSDSDFIILSLYVDDMLIVGHDTLKIDKLKRDLGPSRQILGMKISRDSQNEKLWLFQESTLKRYLIGLT